ncbi:unannotated protein [freshwater metagenome]|uniref:Unannotated protein n=1 Tax=freshwater metagenome TaxID=449393 RepID=A0A6J6FNX5_9ZZZZ
MLDGDNQPLRPSLIPGVHLIHRPNSTGWNSRFVELLEQGGGLVLRERGFEKSHKLSVINNAVAVLRETRIIIEVECCAKRLPVSIVADGNLHHSVSRSEQPVWR